MANDNVKKLTQGAMFAALCCVGTMAVQIPTLNGYVHLGDCFVLLSGALLGGAWGAAAAGIGSMLADAFTGYAYWCPGTFVIKAGCAAIMWLFCRRSTRTAAAAAGALAAEAFMVAGYFAYDAVMLGSGLGAAVSIPSNMVQGLFAVAAGTALLKAAQKCLPALSHRPG